MFCPFCTDNHNIKSCGYCGLYYAEGAYCESGRAEEYGYCAFIKIAENLERIAKALEKTAPEKRKQSTTPP